jgi:hypothetical protein
MAYGITLVFENVNEGHYWAVNDKLGMPKGSWKNSDAVPKGLVTHIAGPTPTGWVVMEVWDSKADQEAFMGGRLGAALGAVGMPAPAQVIETDAVALEQLR